MAISFPFSVVLSAVDKLSGPLGQVESRLGRIGKGLTSAGRGLTIATAPLAVFGGLALRNTASLEDHQHRLRATLGANADQMERMAGAARALASSPRSPHGLAEITRAQLELAEAGLSALQVEQAFTHALELAAATGKDYAVGVRATTLLLRSQRMETGALAHANDVLVAAQARSSATLEDLLAGLERAGPVARGLKMPFEAQVAALAALADQGMAGSEGGSALASTLERLANLTPKAQAELAKLGLDPARLRDAGGALLPLPDILDRLAESGADAESVLAALGPEAGRALVAMMEAGAHSIRSFQADLETGVAGQTSALAIARMQGLAGATRDLANSVELLGTTLSESGLLEWLTKLARRGAAVSRWAAELDPRLLRVAGAFGLLAVAAGPTLIVFGQMANGARHLALGSRFLLVSGLRPLIGFLRARAIPAIALFGRVLLATPIGRAITLVALLVSGIVWLTRNWDKVTAAASRAWDATSRFLQLDKVAGALRRFGGFLGFVDDERESAPRVGRSGRPAGGSAGFAAAVASSGRDSEQRTVRENRVTLDFHGLPRGVTVRPDGPLPREVALRLGYAMGDL